MSSTPLSPSISNSSASTTASSATSSSARSVSNSARKVTPYTLPHPRRASVSGPSINPISSVSSTSTSSPSSPVFQPGTSAGLPTGAIRSRGGPVSIPVLRSISSHAPGTSSPLFGGRLPHGSQRLSCSYPSSTFSSNWLAAQAESVYQGLSTFDLAPESSPLTSALRANDGLPGSLHRTPSVVEPPASLVSLQKLAGADESMISPSITSVYEGHANLAQTNSTHEWWLVVNKESARRVEYSPEELVVEFPPGSYRVTSYDVGQHGWFRAQKCTCDTYEGGFDKVRRPATIRDHLAKQPCAPKSLKKLANLQLEMMREKKSVRASASSPRASRSTLYSPISALPSCWPGPSVSPELSSSQLPVHSQAEAAPYFNFSSERGSSPQGLIFNQHLSLQSDATEMAHSWPMTGAQRLAAYPMLSYSSDSEFTQPDSSLGYTDPWMSTGDVDSNRATLGHPLYVHETGSTLLSSSVSGPQITPSSLEYEEEEFSKLYAVEDTLFSFDNWSLSDPGNSTSHP